MVRFISSPRYTAVAMLGATLYDAHDKDDGIEIYFGFSCNKKNMRESTSTGIVDNFEVSSQVASVVHLPNKHWDEDNMRFQRVFEHNRMETPNMKDICDVDLSSNRFFGLMWKSHPTSIRSISSADALHTGDVILGTLTLSLPSAEIIGSTASSLRDELTYYIQNDKY